MSGLESEISESSGGAGEPAAHAVPANTTQSAPQWIGFFAVGLAGVLLGVVVLWGQALVRRGPELFLQAPPFVGTWQLLWSPGLWWALAIAVLVVTWWVPAVERLRWGWLLVGSAVFALLWPVLLQASAGRESLSLVLGNKRAYLPTAQAINSPAEFLSTFVDRLPGYPTHVKGHPPGATLAHWLFDQLSGGRLELIAAAFLIIAASAAPAALIALDRVAGREAARRAAPFVGLAPAVIWIASSPDAMFMGVLAWSVALGAVALTATPRWGLVAGFMSGLMAGVCLSLSYGLMLLLGPLWAIALLALRRGRWQPLLTAALGFVVVPGLFMLLGFNWIEGLAGTRTAYLAGVAAERPDRYFVISNLVVLAVAIGPAAVAGIVWLRDRLAWWLVGGALFGVIAADLSTMSKGEVERIWLPAVPFLVLATCAISGRTARRWWLGSQLSVALLLQVFLRSPW